MTIEERIKSLEYKEDKKVANRENLIGLEITTPNGQYNQLVHDALISILSLPIPRVREKPLNPFMEIRLECGLQFTIKNIEDFPHTSVPCSCGNPTHWFVKYRSKHES